MKVKEAVYYILRKIRIGTTTKITEFETTGVDWTAPCDGIMTCYMKTKRDDSEAYWYVQDNNEGLVVSALSSEKSRGFAVSTSFPVQKGHVYRTTSKATTIDWVNAHFRPFGG